MDGFLGDQHPFGVETPSTFDFESTHSAVVVYINGDPDNFAVYQFASSYYGTFDGGNVYVSNGGSKDQGVNSSVYQFRLVGNQIKYINSWTSNEFEALRQIVIGPNGDIFVCAFATSRVIKFNKNLVVIDQFTNKIDGPWGSIFDSIGTDVHIKLSNRY